jgi:hypothetical protein
MKKSFILYHDLCEVLDDLTDEQAGKLFKEIHNYSKSKTQKNPEKPTGLNGLLKAVFNPFKAHIDRDFELWQEKRQINIENGKKGGRPRKKKTHNNPQKGVNVNVNDNVTVKEKENKNKNYKWEGKVIRLTEKDFNSWQANFSNLDLKAELQSLDDYYSKEGVTDWFSRCSGALNKRNKESRPITPKSNWSKLKDLTEEEKYGYSLDD